MQEAVLFDLDGTLVDSARDIATAANRALKDLGRPVRDEQEVRAFIGDGVQKLMERCLGTDGASLQQAVARFRHHYELCAIDTTTLFPGVDALLDAIDVPMAVVSNKPEAFCRRMIDGLGATRWFSEIVGGDTFPEPKPSRQPVVGTCARLGVSPESTVLVGDGRQDVAAGLAAGCRVIGVCWGQSRESQLREWGADTVVATVEALLGTLSGP